MGTATYVPGANSQSGTGTAWTNPADAYNSGTGTPASVTWDYSGNSQTLSLTGWGPDESGSLNSYTLSGYAWSNSNLEGQGSFSSVTLTIDGNELDLTSSANSQLGFTGGSGFNGSAVLLSFVNPISVTLAQLNAGITLDLTVTGSSSSTGNSAYLSQWWIAVDYTPIGTPPPPWSIVGSGRGNAPVLTPDRRRRGRVLALMTPAVSAPIVTPQDPIIVRPGWVERD